MTPFAVYSSCVFCVPPARALAEIPAPNTVKRVKSRELEASAGADGIEEPVAAGVSVVVAGKFEKIHAS